MLQLAYMSLVAPGVTQDDTARIAAHAQGRNRADEITGALLGDSDHFLQVLEGPKVSVEDTFLRIMTDPRHHSLTLLSRRLVTVREFGIWDMALCETDAECTRVIEQIRHLVRNAAEPVRHLFATWYPERG